MATFVSKNFFNDSNFLMYQNGDERVFHWTLQIFPLSDQEIPLQVLPREEQDRS